jgi:hypothetical protein
VVTAHLERPRLAGSGRGRQSRHGRGRSKAWGNAIPGAPPAGGPAALRAVRLRSGRVCGLLLPSKTDLRKQVEEPNMVATWARRCFGVLVGAAAVTAAEPGVAAPAAPRPAVAILHGTYDNDRHRDEHDAALAQLGWPATKYALRDVPRLVAELERYDLVIGNPLFNYGPDTRDLGVDGERWRAFLDRGGAVVLTDCNYPSCVDWLARLGPGFEVSTEPCASAAAAVPADPVPALLSLPNPWAVRNSWQHLVAAAPGWEIAGRCGDGQAVVALHREGRGLLVLSSLWPLRAAHLENAWANLQLQRQGLLVTQFEAGALTVGPGRATVGLKRLRGGSLTVALRHEAGPEGGTPVVTRGTDTVVAEGATAVLELAYRIHARGPARVSLWLEGPTPAAMLLDRALVLPPLLRVRVKAPGYRATSTPATWPGAITLAVSVAPDEERLADVALAAVVSDPAGKEVARAEVSSLSVGEVEMRLPLATVAAGDYAVRVQLSERGGKVVATAASTVSVLPDSPTTVLIDDSHWLVVGGRPFFPLGLYHVAEAELAAIAGLGFNTVQGWGGDVAKARRFLDTAQAQGLKVLLEMGPLVVPLVDEPAIRQHVEAFARHPALLAWYVRDEPSPEQHDSVRRAADLFRTLDPCHPTYLVSCQPAAFSEQAGLADIFAVDPYPLPGGSVAMVAQWADQAWAATRGERPVWIIPQAHDQSSYGEVAPKRGANPPTAAQQRCMTYLALVHAAKGLVWYTWDDGPNMGLKYYPAQQDALRDLCREIRGIAPALLQGTTRRVIVGEGRVHVLVCVSPAGRYLIAVNAAERAATVEVAVEEALPEQVFTPLAGGPGRLARAGRLALELEPLGVQVLSF